MSSVTKKIIAVGGGGFTHNSDRELDQFILSQFSKEHLKIGFLGTASKDDQYKVNLFYERFDNQKNQLSHFNLSRKLDGFRKWLFEQNIVYIGGGNTNYMLNLWSDNNLKVIFKEAYEKGIILSGVSAGAVCWFEWILTDSLGNGYQPLKLSLIHI